MYPEQFIKLLISNGLSVIEIPEFTEIVVNKQEDIIPLCVYDLLNFNLPEVKAL